ncbi:MAG: hypothetical protein Q4C72_03830 [Eubacteriales bacterium]|nr:hypothetical protein [Eubacteriales bacterium]
MGLIYPDKCVLCGETLPLDAGKAMVCAACAGEVRQKYRCAETVRIDDADGAAAPLYYTGKVSGAMQRLKFHHKQHYADWFAAQTLPLLTERLDRWQPDLITYMPIGPLRWYQRGYNQAELIARKIAEPLGLPCRAALDKRLFSRRQSRQQGLAARQKNVEHAFLPAKGVDLGGLSVVLVDDIITTGSSAASAVKILRQMGAARVYVLASTLARQKR